MGSRSRKRFRPPVLVYSCHFRPHDEIIRHGCCFRHVSRQRFLTVLICHRILSRFPLYPRPLPGSVPDATFSIGDLPDHSTFLAGCVILMRSFRDWRLICQITPSPVKLRWSYPFAERSDIKLSYKFDFHHI